MANSWHLHVAKFLLVLLLQNACSTTAGTRINMEVHRPPYQSAIQTVLAITTAVAPSWVLLGDIATLDGIWKLVMENG